MKKRISTHLLLLVVGLIILPFALLFVGSLLSYERVIQNELSQRIIGEVRHSNDELNRLFEKMVNHWGQHGYALVGEAVSGADALRQIPKLRPDIVLTDLVMEDIDGISLIKECRSGYLTISPRTPTGSQLIWLDFPNDEVRGTFTIKLLAREGIGTQSKLATLRDLMLASAENGDVPTLIDGIESLFSQIPYELHIKDERYYHSVFLSFMVALGARVEGEKSVSTGRVDAVLEMPKHLYVMEFKRDKDAQTAISQILERCYGKPYTYLKGLKQVHLVGINVDTKTRQVTVKEEPIAG